MDKVDVWKWSFDYAARLVSALEIVSAIRKTYWCSWCLVLDRSYFSSPRGALIIWDFCIVDSYFGKSYLFIHRWSCQLHAAADSDSFTAWLFRWHIYIWYDRIFSSKFIEIPSSFSQLDWTSNAIMERIIKVIFNPLATTKSQIRALLKDLPSAPHTLSAPSTFCCVGLPRESMKLTFRPIPRITSSMPWIWES